MRGFCRIDSRHGATPLIWMLFTLIVYVAMSIVLIKFARLTRRQPTMFRSWDDVRRAWRTSRGALRIVLVVALLMSIVFRPAGVWSAVIAIVGGFVAIVSAFLGWDWWRIMQLFRELWREWIGLTDAAPTTLPATRPTGITS